MSRKVLVTGCEGMLASDLVRIWSDSGYLVTGMSHSKLDITDREQLREILYQQKPNIVVNTPGLGVDHCESMPDAGFQLHSWAAGTMARLCEEIGAIFVYISTCGLFDDEIKFNSEYSPVTLKTQYARSKYLGEELSSKYCSRTFVFRPGWLFGGTPRHGRNFVYQRYLEARQKPVVTSANDKFGCPTSTIDLSHKMLEIIESNEFGLYHLTNSGSASRYEYVKFIVESFGLDTSVEPVDSSGFSRSAPVPDCEMLENMNIKFLGMDPMPDWQEAIDQYISALDDTVR